MVEPLDWRLMTEATFYGKAAEQDDKLDNFGDRVAAVEVLGGLAPGDVSDATMTSIAANPESAFHTQQQERLSASAGTVSTADHGDFETALAMAYATGRTLVIDGDVTAQTVPRSIFEVPTSGKGSITSGGNKFWVNPQHQGIQTNRIYINPTTGSDLNSGINPAMPVKTFTRLNIFMTMLREKLLDGFWEIVIQGGAHEMGSGWIMDGLRTKWPLVITGEGDKATVLDGSSGVVGRPFMFKHLQTVVHFKNMRIQNFIGGSENDGYDTSAAIICQGPGQVRVENVDITDCTTGISLGYGISGSVYGCNISGSVARSLNSSVSTGISVIYGASVTVGASGTGFGNKITHCVTGVHVSRNSVAHVDYNVFEDNYYGLQASHNARVAVITDEFRRNVIGINLSGGAELTYSTAVYGGGADANTQYNMRVGGAARLTSFTGSSTSAVEYRVDSATHSTVKTTTAGMTRQPIVTFASHAAIPANTLLGAGKRVRAVVRGRVLESAGRRRFQLSKNTMDGLNHQVIASLTPSELLGNGAFVLEFITETTSVPGVFVWSASISGYNYSIHTNGVLAGLDISHDWRHRIYQENLDNANDTIEITHEELYVTG